jgi:F-box protein 7
MEIDEPVSVSDSSKLLSVPTFLRKVFNDELGDVGGRRHEILVIAVHAILLESGFVGFNPVSNTLINRLELRKEWPLSMFMMNLSYTLPNLITKSPNDPIGTDFVVLKFQTLGNFLNIYGSLSSGTTTTTHSIQLDEDQLIPFMNIVWANCGLSETIMFQQGVCSKTTTPEAEVLKFWNNVKDSLALPLLMDFCEKAGLKLPPCFTVLPTEIKLKIFESLSGEQIAKVGCVCSELRSLTSSEDLWKQKFEDQFGDAKGLEERNWKQKFVELFRRAKKVQIKELESRYFGGSHIFLNLGPPDMFPNRGPFGAQIFFRWRL